MVSRDHGDHLDISVNNLGAALDQTSSLKRCH